MDTDGMDPNGTATDGADRASVRSGPTKRHGRKVAAALGATTVVALAAGGIAAAGSAGGAQPAHATMTAAAATAQHPAAKHPWLRRVLRHTLHAQFVVRTKGGSLETFDYDRGVLRSVTSTTIVIAPADAPNTTVSATITSTTHFVGLTESQLQPGDKVALVYQGGNAVAVGSRPSTSSASPKG